MVDIRSLISQIPMEPGYVPAPPEPDLSVIQRLMGLPQTLRAVGQNLAVGAASLPVGIYQGFGDPSAGEAAMSQFQQDYGYTPTNPAAQRQLQGLGEFLQQLETEYKIPPMISPSQLPSRAATAGSAMQLGRIGTRMTGQAQDLARDLVREIQTTPPTGAVTMAPSSLPKSDMGFYSQLEAAVQPLQNKGTGQQYLAQIQKSAGVKPEEIQWTGLDTFLQGKQSVTKQEIQDYLNANRVDVQEVRLDRSLPAVQAERRGAFEAYDRGEITLEQRNAILEQSEPVNTRHHLGAYQSIKTEIPGGENYRELLLTLPDTKGARLDARRAEIQAKGINATDAEKQEWVSIMNQLQPETRDVEGLSPFRNRPEFRSTHFDQPNILAHLRVNDRTVDGKKTLFVEEIQSDWHQAGRKKGYASADTKNAEAAFRQYSQELADKYNLNPEQNLAMYATMKGMQPEEVAKYDQLQSAWVSSKGGVPDAPFKTSWHELSLKRAIQEAAEKGYDQIAFTTGKTQAERYDLSKQIDEINVVGRTNAVTGEKSKSVALDTVDGQSIRLGVAPDGTVDNVNDQAMNNLIGKNLDEVVGKELAKKIIEGGSQTISGEGLKVGGEGMKGFYDNILPKSLDKLGKKFGAKVGKTFIEGERTRDADGFPSMYPEKIEVWQMDITPQMRESVTTKGQPLFAIPAIGAGLLGAGMMQEEEQF
jgi:hypothetical protein